MSATALVSSASRSVEGGQASCNEMAIKFNYLRMDKDELILAIKALHEKIYYGTLNWQIPEDSSLHIKLKNMIKQLDLINGSTYYED